MGFAFTAEPPEPHHPPSAVLIHPIKATMSTTTTETRLMLFPPTRRNPQGLLERITRIAIELQWITEEDAPVLVLLPGCNAKHRESLKDFSRKPVSTSN